jgi:hypothetical protein
MWKACTEIHWHHQVKHASNCANIQEKQHRSIYFREHLLWRNELKSNKKLENKDEIYFTLLPKLRLSLQRLSTFSHHLDIYYTDFHENRRNVKKLGQIYIYAHTWNMDVTGPIVMGLTCCTHFFLQNLCTKFEENRRINVKNEGRYSFTPLSEVWKSPSRFSLYLCSITFRRQFLYRISWKYDELISGMSRTGGQVHLHVRHPTLTSYTPPNQRTTFHPLLHDHPLAQWWANFFGRGPKKKEKNFRRANVNY